MPTSLDPQPREDEIECGRCGAYFYYELTRCPECGVNIYEPEDFDSPYQDNSPGTIKKQNELWGRMRSWIRQIFGKPYSAEEVFGDGFDQAHLYNELLQKVNGDRSVVERLIALEQKRKPNETRRVWLENAIRRWNQDNRTQ